MKKILPFLIYFISGFGAYSQITIRTGDIIDKPVSKPLTFDSLSNLKTQYNAIDYKQYLGHKLFYVPWSKKFSHREPRQIEHIFTKKKSIVQRTGRFAFEEMGRMRSVNTTKFNKRERAEYEKAKEKYNSRDTMSTYVYGPKYYPHAESSSTYEFEGTVRTAPEEIEGKYFTILDIGMREFKNRDSINKYDKLEDIKDYGKSIDIQLTLKDDLTNDTVYWRPYSAGFMEVQSDFFLVPYFVKQKNTYLNQRLVAKKSFDHLVDVNTGAIVQIKPGDIWLCTDVSFTDLEHKMFLTPLVYLKNGEKAVALEFKFLDKDSFIFEKEVLKREEENKKLAAQKLKEQQAWEREIKADELKRRNHLIKIYGQKVGAYIAEGNIVLGMTKEMCRAAWGDPMDINTTTVSGLTREQWVYGGGNYLYFDNGTLKVIQR